MSCFFFFNLLFIYLHYLQHWYIYLHNLQQLHNLQLLKSIISIKSIYTGELSDIIKPHLPSVMCYADDTQLYVSFSPKDNFGEDEAIAAMERYIKDIRKWMKEAKLQLNSDKTELLLIGTKQQLQKINMSTSCVGNDLIKPSKEIKNLGVWLDPSLTMNTHINKTCSIAFYHLYNLRRIQKYLSQEWVEILIHTLIYSRIDYCNSLYLGLSDYQIQKIQRVQNAAARLAYNAGKYCHITPFLFKDGAYYCYCAYVLRISRYSDFLSPMLTDTGIFLRGLKLSGESRS